MRKITGYIILTLCSLLISGHLFSAPKVTVLSLGLDTTTGSSRATIMADLFSQHLENIMNTVAMFSLVTDPDLTRQLQNTDNPSDAFLNNFAKRADIPLVVKGSIQDRGKHIILRIYAFAHDVPFNGSLVANHEVEIPILSGTSSRELSYIMEEHTGRFLVQLLNTYTKPIHFTVPGDGQPVSGGSLSDGIYPLYTVQNPFPEITGFTRKGSVTVSDNRIKDSLPDGKYFLLRSFTKQADELEKFYYGRKREIVFPQSSLENTIIAALAAPLLSIVSPIGTPISYYLTSDYQGLGLWAVHNSPYLYTAVRGFRNSPESLREQHADISQLDKSIHYYSYYYFLTSGMALYADAIGHHASYQASNYKQPLLFTGNSDLAVYLSVMGNGAGHFYKGYRSWGYFYFHTDNLLTLSSLYFLLDEETYADGSYTSSGSNRTLGYSLLAGAVAVRIAEVFHCSMLNFNIQNGKQLNHRMEIVPEIRPDPVNGSTSVGLSFIKRL